MNAAVMMLTLMLSACDASTLVPSGPSYSTSADECTSRKIERGTAPEYCYTAAFTGNWDQVLADTAIVGDVVVPSGETWLIGADVRISGNLRTDAGTIAMRPGSTLQFVGAKASQYVGGGMAYDDRFRKDWGIWVGGTGVLDIQGTPKPGWSRSFLPNWAPTDEVYVTPTAPRDYSVRRYSYGAPIPNPVDPRVPGAELVNVTRDIQITGPGHIHISSRRPQTIRYVTLRRMGIIKPSTGEAGVASGRYGIHLHMMGNAAQGTVVEGVALIGSEGRGLVPHASHGVVMRDNVSINSFVEGFWWDPGEEHATNDLMVDRLLVCGVYAPRTLTGVAARWDAISLSHGSGNKIDNSVACGARGSQLSNGYEWAAGGSELLVWDFGRNNVAHNNSGSGTRIWNNSRESHHIAVAAYNNGAAGVQNGAYSNANRYGPVLLIGNGLDHNSNSGSHELDEGPGRYSDLTVVARSGPAITIGNRQLAAKTYQEFVDCSLRAGPDAPLIFVKAGTPLGESPTQPWLARFIRCNVTPADIIFEAPKSSGAVGSHIFLEHVDGRKWEIQVRAGGEIDVRRR